MFFARAYLYCCCCVALVSGAANTVPASSSSAKPVITNVGLSYAELLANAAPFAKHFSSLDSELSKVVASHPDGEAKIAQYAGETRMVIHDHVQAFARVFLRHKQRHGSKVEKAVYKNITSVEMLFERLIKKRPLAFVGPADSTLLRPVDVEGAPPQKKQAIKDSDWDAVGSSKETVLHLQDYLSYDEMAISALIAVSSPAFFINSGSRGNLGVKAQPSEPFQPEGIFVGIVGTRFERLGHMESLFLLSPKGQTAKDLAMKPDVLELWQKFYPSKFLSFEEAEQLAKAKSPLAANYIYIDDDKVPMYFNRMNYAKRAVITAETLILEAEERGKRYNQKVLVHVTGVGLGAWARTPKLKQIMMPIYLDAFGVALRRLTKSSPQHHIHTVRFSWVPDSTGSFARTHKDVLEGHPTSPIKVVFSQDDPAVPLPSVVAADGGKISLLLVASFGWDGNSFVGNEFYWGNLAGSADPAAVACSTIGYTQNPYINPFTQRICYVNGYGKGVTTECTYSTLVAPVAMAQRRSKPRKSRTFGAAASSGQAQSASASWLITVLSALAAVLFHAAL